MSRNPRLEDLPAHLQTKLRLSAKAQGVELVESRIGTVKPAPTAHSIMRERAGGVAQVHKAGEMNRTETAFASEVLDVRKAAGQVTAWAFEGITFRLADGVRYTPDFVAQLVGGRLVVFEVKPASLRARGAAGRVKLQFAADQFSWVVSTWFRVWRERRGQGGAGGEAGWTFELVTAAAHVHKA